MIMCNVCAIAPELLNKVKTSLRISHNALDDDLKDTIKACFCDLDSCGVRVTTDDALILNAVKLFCKAAYTDDTGKAAAYQARYDSLKSCLMMAESYKKVGTL